MADLPEAGAKLTLDLGEWNRNWASAEDTATSVMDSIPTEAEVSIDISMGDDSAFADIEALDGASIEPELNTSETDTSKEIRDGLNFLVAIEKIKIAIDVIGTAWEFIQKIGDMVVTPFLDVEDAVAKINAQTGGTGIEDLGQLIRDIQFADLGESVDQIGKVIIKAQQLGLPIEEAARAALTFTHTWTEENPETVIGTLGSLVQTGLVDNLQEAADLMTVFFQQGGNVGGDALAVVEANSQAWADMGLTAAEALSTMESLQQGTGATATDAAKMIQTFDDAMTAAASDPGSEQAKMLKLMGVGNPKDQGEAIGAETINGFAEAFANMPSDVQDQISGLFFGKGGKKFTGAIENMTTEGGMFADVVGAAEAAAAAADDSLRGIIDDFVLAMNEQISNLLSSDAIDLPGKIEAIKKGLQDALGVLTGGGTVGEALEVGFNITGVDTALANVERIFGQFVITLLEVLAAIQDPLGINDNDAGARAQIKQLATQQLPFDIKVANPEELDAIFNQAANRGVTDLGGALNTALTELVSEGDFVKVNDILDQIAMSAEVTPEAIAALREKYEALIAAAQPPPPKLDAKQIDTSALSDALGFVGGASRGTGEMPEWFKAFAGTEAQTAIDETAEKIDTMGTNITGTMATTSAAVTTSGDEMIASMEGVGLQADIMDADIAGAMMGNTVTQSFQAVSDKADEAFPNVIDWFARTAAAAARFDAIASVHFRSVLKQLNDINIVALQVIANVTQATALGGGGGGGTTVTNNSVVVNNTVPTGAAAVANGYAIARSLRPGG